ncbi:single-stranded DNA-binding protein [Staphylococcus aureus DAR3928]|nr:single-stranded DNA-binding protein [Staphylococcus aureus DAR3928]
MLNRTILVGRLTRDPELRTTQSGVNVASFTLAVNRTFTNAQGEREADFINIIVFKKQAVTAPIFIDNAESVTELIKTESQQIQLIVNEQDKKLRMETI